MEPPNIQGYKILAEIGTGASGTVYEAEREDGSRCAIKAFEVLSSNSSLLASRVSRVMEGGFRNVAVPVLAQTLEARPSCIVMPLMADREAVNEGEALEGFEQYRPRTLQTFFEKYQSNDQSWPLILRLASRLAALHTSKVAHGNLKPGNIFFENEGEPLFADYASGFMPGVHRMTYSDALLYAPPEQLRYPEGYLEEAGYRWDVYAFGVLAYRLLTGVFPRCHEVFEGVSPAPGTQQRFGIEADYQGIAEGLEGDATFSWPTEPKDEREARRREIVNFCLSLDPMGRPGNMREVTRYFDRLEGELATEAEKRRLVASEKSALRKKGVMTALFAVASLIALGLGAAWALTQNTRVGEARKAQAALAEYQAETEASMRALKQQRDASLASEEKALNKRVESQIALKNEQGKAAIQLTSVQQTNDTLFNWLLEEGIDNLPVLEGRAERLTYLTEKIDEQLQGLAERPELAKHAALLRLRKAELALARGDLRLGKLLLNEAVEQGDLTEDYLARARMRLLLVSSKLDPKNLDPLIDPTELIAQRVWVNDESRALRAKAAIELARGRMWMAKGDTSRAELDFLASLKSYQELAELHPENPTAALLVGRRYLSAASAAEGEGAFENAAKLRADAAASFSALAKKQKNPSPELEYQIASATAARAVSKWQQGDTFGAEALAREGVAKLRSLAGKLPDDFRLAVDLASQQGIIATALRDEGKPKEAQALLSKSIKNLEAGLANQPKHWSGRYLLASLKWQLAGLMGLQGQSESELEMGEVARGELRALLASEMTRPHPSEVRKSLAYLCTDLGYSADLRNKRELAVKYLEEAKILWQELARDEGDQLEIRQGYHSANNRLGEMGVK